MNNKILYATMTGHSKKIATAISEELNIPVYNLASNPEIGECDILYLVQGIYGGESKAELLAFAKNMNPQQIKKVVLLTSSTRNVPQGSLKNLLKERGVCVEEEEYSCKGSFLIAAMGHPNRKEIVDAVSFAKQRADNDTKKI